jgi:hypothetical protein
MRAICMSMMKPESRRWLRRCCFWTVVGLAAMFDSELKLGILDTKELGCLFCCYCTIQKLPVGLLDCCNFLVYHFYHGASLNIWISLDKEQPRYSNSLYYHHP